VIAHCRERLADFKCPQYSPCCPSRCHATRGKVLKAQLRDEVDWGQPLR